jgi:hypothetical protein
MLFTLARASRRSTIVLGSGVLAAALFADVPALGTAGQPLAAGAGTQLLTPQVRQVPVSGVAGSGASGLVAQSTVQPVDGYGVVGATWRGQPSGPLRLLVRTRSEGTWSAWQQLYYHLGEHAPDPASPEADGARTGTDPFAVGEVDGVQLRAYSSTGRVPRDLQLSVINPGRLATDTPKATSPASHRGIARDTAPRPAQGPTREATVAGQQETSTAGVRAPRPRIRWRKDWGANERWRSSRPRYGRVKAGFVHHTVNANRYSRSDVPAIIRGIYAYHTKSLGWSDIGYNFLVDRFGRKWIGRYGGAKWAVVGAHTYGYNHLSTGMAAIGNFQKRRPSKAMVRAFGRMMGWKLGLHGVRAGDRSRWLDGTRFKAITGHRNAGQTLCPGRYLQRRLPAIRRTATRWQQR